MGLARRIIDFVSGLIIVVAMSFLFDLLFSTLLHSPFGSIFFMLIRWEYYVFGIYCCIIVFFLFKSYGKIYPTDSEKTIMTNEQMSSLGWVVALYFMPFNIQFSLVIGIIGFGSVLLVGFLLAFKMSTEWISKRPLMIKIGRYCHYFFIQYTTDQSYCEECGCFRWNERKDEILVCGLCGTPIKKDNEEEY